MNFNFHSSKNWVSIGPCTIQKEKKVKLVKVHTITSEDGSKEKIATLKKEEKYYKIYKRWVEGQPTVKMNLKDAKSGMK